MPSSSSRPAHLRDDEAVPARTREVVRARVLVVLEVLELHFIVERGHFSDGSGPALPDDVTDERPVNTARDVFVVINVQS